MVGGFSFKDFMPKDRIAYYKKYYYTHREYTAKKRHEYYLLHKNEYNARRKKYEILKSVCYFCDNDKTVGHHYNYETPTKIIWLCKKCHGKLHFILKITK
jgi:hypothetical protein